MSVIREVTSASLTDAWRTIDIDALQEDSPANFDTSTLHPPLPEIGEADVRALAGQIRQLLRGGDSEGALRGCLEMPVYNGADLAKVRKREGLVRKSSMTLFAGRPMGWKMGDEERGHVRDEARAEGGTLGQQIGVVEVRLLWNDEY